MSTISERAYAALEKLSAYEVQVSVPGGFEMKRLDVLKPAEIATLRAFVYGVELSREIIPPIVEEQTAKTYDFYREVYVEETVRRHTCAECKSPVSELDIHCTNCGRRLR